MTAHPPPEDPVPPAADDSLLPAALTYAWNWTDSYFKVRVQAINFHVVSAAFFITAYLTCLAGHLNWVATAVALVAALSALGFLSTERQLRGRIMVGEKALVALEELLSDRLKVDSVRVTFYVRHGAASRKVRYIAAVVQAAYFFASAAWLVAAAYGAFRK